MGRKVSALMCWRGIQRGVSGGRTIGADPLLMPFLGERPMSIVEVHFAGKKFKLDNSNGADLVVDSPASGAYEPPLPLLTMPTLLRIEGDFIDVGANTGIYSIMARSSHSHR
jgi:hypothetical protein